MVGVGIAGSGVEKDGQTITVEHEPRQERSQQRAWESNLIHRLRMRPDERVVPASERRIWECRRHALAQASGAVTARYRIVIDVGVVVPDDLRTRGRSHGWKRAVLAHRKLLIRDRR